MESSFVLWQPTLDDNHKGCYFDVQPDDFVQLKDGDRELIELFLHDLGIEAIVESWRIESFCTPYYAHNYISHWRDQYPIAWRVYVKFLGNGLFVKPFSFQPYLSKGVDSTWQEQEDSWTWSVGNCVVIGDFHSKDEANVLQSVSKNFASNSYKNINLFHLNDYFTQARFHLGNVHFPEESERVNDFVSKFKKIVPSAHWASTLQLWEHTGHKKVNTDWKKLLN